ncbi:fluoride efflux transporter FluC [Natronogracilivirga saccharolytica]|uniref:Fluoride-specific ion channel FluC n=1 Tax=Natronogracilivirga saccharolytica TaxID=2812953 RepID=A0A8J7S837_9BACT|nr:CrcB family protein [Natronogracilivirga saccharolytica]MBP3193678.1 CrcB family protein [Natronogracilivirga saccharolytica]
MTYDITGELLISLAAAGALGALLRYAFDNLVHRLYTTRYPSGILLVNLSGAFFAGWLAASAATGLVTEQQHIILAVGFAGSYTTFSGWMVQTVELALAGVWGQAFSNIMLHVVFGWLLTMAGLWLGAG